MSIVYKQETQTIYIPDSYECDYCGKKYKEKRIEVNFLVDPIYPEEDCFVEYYLCGIPCLKLKLQQANNEYIIENNTISIDFPESMICDL